jgi:hypothetical protein
MPAPGNRAGNCFLSPYCLYAASFAVYLQPLPFFNVYGIEHKLSTTRGVNMKRYGVISIIILTALLLTACGWSGFRVGSVRGSGNVQSETRTVSGFQNISVEGTGDIYLTQGEEESLTIEAEDNLIPRITTEVRGSVLHIGFKRNAFLGTIFPSKPIKFYITVKDLTNLEINGAGRVNMPGLQTDSLQLTVNGAAQIDFATLNANSLKINIAGGGDCAISGEAASVDVRVDGAGSVNLQDLQSKQAAVTINGAAGVKVWATDVLKAEINGAGTVSYYGSPQVTQSIDGIGNIKGLGEH